MEEALLKLHQHSAQHGLLAAAARGPILSALFECEFLEEGRKGDGTGWKEEREEGHYVHRKTEKVEVGSYACSRSSRLILGENVFRRERERERGAARAGDLVPARHARARQAKSRSA